MNSHRLQNSCNGRTLRETNLKRSQWLVHHRQDKQSNQNTDRIRLEASSRSWCERVDQPQLLWHETRQPSRRKVKVWQAVLRISHFENKITKQKSCSIYCARAYMRIMRADTCAHTYIKFVKSAVAHSRAPTLRRYAATSLWL